MTQLSNLRYPFSQNHKRLIPTNIYHSSSNIRREAMVDTLLYNYLVSGLVPPSPDSEMLYLQVEQKKLLASLMESPAGKRRKNISPNLGVAGSPMSHLDPPHLNEVKHWIFSVYIVSDLSFYHVAKKIAS